jgi:hypothetical protein
MARTKTAMILTRLRRLLLSLALVLAFLSGSSADSFAAQKKAVHVKEYQKKDGTTVKAHDRAASKSKTAKQAKEKTSAKRPLADSPSSSSVKRDSNGRIERSEAAKHQFEVRSGYPHGRPGYVIDHIKPIACGGADAPSNMQWQTVAEGKEKDKWERAGCR